MEPHTIQVQRRIPMEQQHRLMPAMQEILGSICFAVGMGVILVFGLAM